jgi:hypothetical protein
MELSPFENGKETKVSKIKIIFRFFFRVLLFGTINPYSACFFYYQKIVPSTRSSRVVENKTAKAIYNKNIMVNMKNNNQPIFVGHNNYISFVNNLFSLWVVLKDQVLFLREARMRCY